MSGHSKWATIKRKKAAIDAKRGKIFTKLIKELMIAARDGGGDPEANPRLRQAISTAKAANMPNDNINRAILKGTGDLEGVTYEESTYEGYGPGGVAIFLEVLTDNKKRTVADIRHLMNKHGGNLGENGSVAWMFEKQGQISLSADGLDENTVFEEALEVGADDFSNNDGEFIITTVPSETVNVSDALSAKGYEITSSAVEMVPKNTVKVEGNDVGRLMTLMEGLEENEDIQNLYSNFDLDEADL
ncbi:MAG: YebC/PmpR family DNA-binding transcriptional regulator [Candidatus Marinimicrobia bacterium]|jgi:YebC/PmpR family DNA-binding regulatory protein|nr:YebC/PmpR family DNA-binding transcriptional regulator [Candidatus Neomarinimicrobiota bacterium]MBT3675609.1 YebC/PmpR family DNA-binding transcriptional regulator [Candidatus Neomarinimicrobiota bacterium]MBT3762556.1 YebC/PmpR family DNA-binding transcriptional regulator [Candidatus Neomarinimicrobiota bacterium]MBT4067162.1 YebC/PmpR family DNA-binding transcriptional regulator [Candidatus Neomarinimicrobiota bacterium]MBT4270024.1 YebC/PmpR family DNA-binding transcriptional regulator [